MIKIATPEDLKKYLVTENHPQYSECMERAKAVVDGGLADCYYFPRFNNVELTCEIRDANFFVSGLIYIREGGMVNNCFTYQRSIEEF